MNVDDQPLDVAAITGGVDDPSSRFRVRQFIEPLTSHKIVITEMTSTAGRYPPRQRGARAAWLPRALGASGRNAIRARQSDVCLLQREMVSTLPTFEWLAGRPSILDIDDAVHLKQRFDAIDRIASWCDLVICGNEELADYYSRFGSVVVIPTAVDTNRYAPVHRDPKSPTLGWMGTSSNLPELDDISDALEAIFRRRSDVRMRVVSNDPSAWRLSSHPSVTGVRWSSLTEVDEIRRFDVGLMPLRDTQWNRGKCGFKLLTYLSCGVAAVGSPVGVNPDILGNEITLLPQTSDDWIDAIETLIDDDTGRGTVASRGRQRVVETYSVDAVTPLLASALRSVR